jgi:hypothetical protein
MTTARHSFSVVAFSSYIRASACFYSESCYVHPSLRAADLAFWRRSNLRIVTGIASGTPALAGGARENKNALAMTKNSGLHDREFGIMET